MLLGIDVGTTGVKATLFSEDGQRKGYGFREYGVDFPEAFYAEQDAEMVWENTLKATVEAIGSLGDQVKALGVSVQGDAIIPVDKNNKALTPAQLGMDYRGQAQVAYCEEHLGSRYLFERTGMRPHPMNSVMKILWLMENQPEIASRAHKFVTYSDFILAKFGSDDFVIDYTMASRTMLFGVKEKKWDDSLIEQLGIDRSKLSKPVPSGTPVGTISGEISALLGINPKTLLIAGGHDQTCAALGAGITKQGLALDSHGTAEVLSACLDSPPNMDVMFDSYYPFYLHTVRDKYFTFALNHTSGILLQWYRDNLAEHEVTLARETGKNTYEVILAGVEPTPSPLLVLPHFVGSGTPTCDTASRGAILGLTLASTRFDIAAGILDSLIFEMRLNLDVMKTAGINITELRAVGGGVRSSSVVQRKADALGLPVHTLVEREAACLGAALLAGLGCGIYSDIEETALITKTGCCYEPNPQCQDLFHEKYQTYEQLYDTIKPLNNQIGGGKWIINQKR